MHICLKLKNMVKHPELPLPVEGGIYSVPILAYLTCYERRSTSGGF
jgi:hypothetical protein